MMDNSTAINDRYYWNNNHVDFIEGKSDNIIGNERNEVVYNKPFEDEIRSKISDYRNSLQTQHGDSVYVGKFGLEMLNLLLYDRFNDRSALKNYDCNLKLALDCSKTVKRIPFLNGPPGILSITAVMAARLGEIQSTKICVERLLELSSVVCDKMDTDTPDEILYGRAGYLYALLYVRKECQDSVIPDGIVNTIRKVLDRILSSGRALAREQNSRAPLMYKWHDKEYVGAAHGYIGILYMCLEAKEFLTNTEVNNLIKPTIDYIMDLRLPSGNFPSSVKRNPDDRLMQWCHGAPGAVFLMARAYQVFNDQKYLDAALECGELVWSRGLLKKGYSLCHGVSGNGYTFLVLYKLTKDIKHLHRATKFATWCFSYGSKQECTPDRPNSLYEGLAGVIYFLVDVLFPECSNFPGFEL